MRTRLAVACAIALGALGVDGAFGQQCPNPSTGPLQGTPSEYCLTQTEANNVDFNQPVFVTTTIGPVVTTPVVNSRSTVCRARWTNPFCWPIPCEQAAQQPNDPTQPPGDGSSSGGFTAGNAQGCTFVVVQEMCLASTQQGWQVIVGAAAACPIPPMPGGGGPPAQSMTATCPCPFVPPMIPACMDVAVPITALFNGTINSIDCTDTANWTDLSGQPQSKVCFIVRQRCANLTISGPYICESQNVVQTPLICWWGAIGIPGIPIPNGGANVNPDDPGDGFDPPSDGQSGN